MSARTTSPGLVLRSLSGAEFRFDPGALCLELLTTGGPGAFARYEVLHEPADLADWAARSRLDPTPRVEATAEETAAARRTRDALWRLALAHLDGGPFPPDDLAALNAAAAEPPLTPAIGADGAAIWAGSASGTALLSTVARDAVRLLTGRYRDRVRMCQGERCHLVYVDISRPGRRRWCSMERCGNLHKVRALRARGKEPGPAAPD